MKEYNNRGDKPLVNPGFTIEQYSPSVKNYSALREAAIDVLDDLERYASKSGSGPDKRLHALKLAIEES